jgi:hypothetical protein
VNGVFAQTENDLCDRRSLGSVSNGEVVDKNKNPLSDEGVQLEMKVAN